MDVNGSTKSNDGKKSFLNNVRFLLRLEENAGTMIGRPTSRC
jgi:hypothetical protein